MVTSKQYDHVYISYFRKLINIKQGMLNHFCAGQARTISPGESYIAKRGAQQLLRIS